MQRLRRTDATLAALTLTLTLTGSARGQTVEVAPFTVATPNPGLEILEGDVTVAPDGKIGVLWVETVPFGHGESSRALVRTITLPGPALGAAHRVDSTGWAEDEVSPSIAPFASGGYVAAWNTFAFQTVGYDFELYGAFLDGEAAPIVGDFEVGPTVNAEQIGSAVGQVVIGLPSGSLFTWSEDPRVLAQRYDALRQPIGPTLVLATVHAVAQQKLSVEAAPDGGFLLLWADSDAAQTWVRSFDFDGQPRGAPISVGPRTMQRIATNPLGGFAVVGTTTGISVRRFDDAGSLVSEDTIPEPNLSSTMRTDLAFDEAGNLLVVWEAPPGGPVPAIGRYRAYDASGTPLGPTTDIDSGAPVSRPRVAALSTGRFVLLWGANSALRAAVLSWCVPSAAVCGDGTALSSCEACDDGLANSDVQPDACRTDCRRAHCGDGVLDSGEECDDGNAVNGDCCSWICRIEPDFDQDGQCDDDCRLFVPDFDQDGVCDPSDDCRLFPDPGQTGGPICDVAPLENLDEDQMEAFADALEEFSRRETPESGLGPVFNGVSCAECHHQPTIGGSSDRTVTRIGRDGPGGVFDPLLELGGPLLQTSGISTASCTVDGEILPPEATYQALRESPPLFGLGLVEAISEKRILKLADPTDRNRDGISGRPNLIGGKIGRFGWKAQSATLDDFAARAYRDEMGITSPAQPDEVAPQGVPAPCDPLADPEDDGADVIEFTTFLRLLAPRPTGALTAETKLGRSAFRRARCHRCHTDKLRTDFAEVRLPSKRVRLFSDLLLHDMGPGLADGIVQGEASAGEFRTAPLWGVKDSAPYLHDGRAPTLADAISAHDGEAADSRSRYLALTPAQQAALLAYLETL